ncbi:hypothetical protein V5J35_001173 [Endozoicomonas sp. NE40]|uniref:Uncharacterized protein n=1 Tax=Endozoicomonas lisbonensis TaxID=3120522 RepID=A0ABV2SDZ2_9GAMM
MVLLSLLLFAGLLRADQINDNRCWCLSGSKTPNGPEEMVRSVGSYLPEYSNHAIIYTFRFLHESRCGSAKSKRYMNIDFGALSCRPQRPVQVAYTAPDGRVVYAYFEDIKASFFQTLTPEKKALILSKSPCLVHSDDLFDRTVRDVWRRILSFWDQPEKGEALLKSSQAARFMVADYVLGFSPPANAYQFPRRYESDDENYRTEDGYFLGEAVDQVALVSQINALRVGQVWLMEESVESATGIYNRYHLCVIYIGGGLFLLLVNQKEQYFLNIDDFIMLVNNTSQSDRKYKWKAAMVRTSNGYESFSLKRTGSHPGSVTDFFASKVNR